MGNIFGKEVPLSEQLRQNKRIINRAIRELDREKLALEREEKRLTIEIKQAAKANQMGAVKIMAKDLVRTRTYITKFIEMRSNLQSCALKLQTCKSQQAMADAMKNTTKAMVKMNKAVDAPGINKMMMEFQRENEKMEYMQEIMGEALDDAMAQPGDEEEEEKIVSQVLDEIGVSIGDQLADAPTGAGKQQVGVADSSQNAALNDLEARLQNL